MGGRTLTVNEAKPREERSAAAAVVTAAVAAAVVIAAATAAVTAAAAAVAGSHAALALNKLCPASAAQPKKRTGGSSLLPALFIHLNFVIYRRACNLTEAVRVKQG